MCSNNVAASILVHASTSNDMHVYTIVLYTIYWFHLCTLECLASFTRSPIARQSLLTFFQIPIFHILTRNTPTSSTTAASNPKRPLTVRQFYFDKAVDTWSLLKIIGALFNCLIAL